jgi:peptidyl-prolyl cis-trans isomerase B (cyclophilin B)
MKRINKLVIAALIVGLGAISAYLYLSPTQEAPCCAPPKEEYAVIETKFGRMLIRFFSDSAPKHVENFERLAREGFYDGTTFHRVIPGFMIQGGDPNTKDADRSNDGFGGPGYNVPAEFNARSHRRGIVSMARGSDPNSAGSQFFIVVSDSTFLDGRYTVFGQVVEGLEVADTIVSRARDGNDNPIERVDVRISIITR